MYLGQNDRYKFYSEEIAHCPRLKLQRIAQACDKVENAVWNAHEDFYTYLKKQSAVLYAKHNDEIIGFALFDLHIKDDSLVVAANECMVLPEHQGYKLPVIFSSLLITHIRKDTRLREQKRPYKTMTLVSTTVNFKMMEAFRRYSFMCEKTSFDPDQHINQVAEEYRQAEELHLINAKNPFFIKGAFPGSSKLPPLSNVPSYVPAEFDLTRGDCFLFVCRVSRFWLLGLMAKITRWRQGFKFSNRIIPISRIYRKQTIYTRRSHSHNES